MGSKQWLVCCCDGKQQLVCSSTPNGCTQVVIPTLATVSWLMQYIIELRCSIQTCQVSIRKSFIAGSETQMKPCATASNTTGDECAASAMPPRFKSLLWHAIQRANDRPPQQQLQIVANGASLSHAELLAQACPAVSRYALRDEQLEGFARHFGALHAVNRCQGWPRACSICCSCALRISMKAMIRHTWWASMASPHLGSCWQCSQPWQAGEEAPKHRSGK